jgi:hypothetical protein
MLHWQLRAALLNMPAPASALGEPHSTEHKGSQHRDTSTTVFGPGNSSCVTTSDSCEHAMYNQVTLLTLRTLFAYRLNAGIWSVHTPQVSADGQHCCLCLSLAQDALIKPGRHLQQGTHAASEQACTSSSRAM